MAKANKYRYVYVLQGNYGYGWDDLTISESYKDIRNDYNDYKRNDTHALRIVNRRILNA